MSLGLKLAGQLHNQDGFERKVYTGQIGDPVFYTRTFEPEDCPDFMASLERDFGAQPGDIDPGVITLEISEDGTLLQACCSLIDYCAGCDPNSNTLVARLMLEEFGISAPYLRDPTQT